MEGGGGGGRIVGLLIASVVLAQLVTAIPWNENSNKPNCSEYGTEYIFYDQIGTLHLSVNKTASSCPRSSDETVCFRLPQIKSLDEFATDKSTQIVTANCSLQVHHNAARAFAALKTIIGPLIDCTYFDPNGEEAVVSYSFPVFLRKADRDPYCVAKDSLVAMYSVVPVIPRIYLSVYSMFAMLMLGVSIMSICCRATWFRKRDHGYETLTNEQ